MSKLNSRFIAVAILCTCTSLSSRAQPVAAISPIVRTQRLLQAAFPELAHKNLSVRLFLSESWDINWDGSGAVFLEVRQPGQRQSDQLVTSDILENQFLRGHVDSDADGRIELAQFSGQFVHTKELRKLSDDAAAHPAWSDSDLQAALMRIGAKYGPANRETFSTTIALNRFEPALGKLKISDLNLKWRMRSGDPATPDLILISWLVKAEEIGSAGPHRCYWMSLEPIDGRLINLDGRFCK